jgi:SAM-dependent methyltransferase
VTVHAEVVPDLAAAAALVRERGASSVDADSVPERQAARMAGSELVDYERVADLYKVGRAVPGEVLDRWGRAVRPHLPAGGRVRVADVGAGTGIFAAAWPDWGASGVVAVEVSAAMAAHGRGAAPYVRAVAEALPLAAGSVDVVWLSTTFHHFADKAAAVAEIDRVLDPGGVVLIRTFLAEQARRSYFGLYPGIEKALRLCPDVAWHAGWFGPGFRVHHVEDLRDVETTYAEAADWVERMRHADSMLTALTDDEVAMGVRRMRATPDETALLDLSLIVLRR